MVLTFGAVVAFPAGEADAVPLERAGVVAELVVPRSAEVGAAVAVVVRVAGHPELVRHERVVRVVHRLRPVLADVQVALRCQSFDQDPHPCKIRRSDG